MLKKRALLLLTFFSVAYTQSIDFFVNLPPGREVRDVAHRHGFMYVCGAVWKPEATDLPISATVNAFVMKLNATNGQVIYSSIIQVTNTVQPYTYCNALAVVDGNMFIAGQY